MAAVGDVPPTTDGSRALNRKIFALILPFYSPQNSLVKSSARALTIRGITTAGREL